MMQTRLPRQRREIAGEGRLGQSERKASLDGSEGERPLARRPSESDLDEGIGSLQQRAQRQQEEQRGGEANT